jgi:DNA polymerase-3 subunit gamma/tau
MAEALYRKYRPETFNEVLGQEHIVKVLEESLNKDNVAHAYLFAGSRGTGKTTLARILANKVNCTRNDLYEIDAASNRGIDDIRELRDAVDTLPFESPYKVYIIDEVHMLTKEAFNALLKTLEEPPKHVIFILATTEIEKLPETITSRCQTFTFKKPSQAVLKEMIINVAKKEGFTLEPASADLIAILAEGSFRDAHGVLQKIIFSSSDKKISIAEVESVTGAPNSELINQFIEAIEKKDLNAALNSVNTASQNSIDMKVFLTLALHKIRAILLLRFASNLKKEISIQYSEEDFQFLDDISKRKGSNIDSRVLNELLNAYGNLGYAHIAHLPIELALIQLLDANN